MANYPRYSLAGSNQYPAVATAIPSQYPVIELVDATGTAITNVGNGPADGTWTAMTLLNSWTAGTVAPMYMKDSRGRVFLRGRIVAPAGLVATSVCWTAPAGHLPLSSGFYFDWVAGGANAGTTGDPKTVGTLSGPTGFIIVNYTGAGAADTAAGKITDLSRFSWPTT